MMMKKNKISGFFGLMLLLAALLSVTSCTEDHYDYPHPLEGCWRADYTDQGQIYYEDAEYFTFYSDGYGLLEYPDDWGYTVAVRFSWETYGGNKLDIYYEDGLVDYYYFRFFRGYLELSDDPHFRYYTGYAPSR